LTGAPKRRIDSPAQPPVRESGPVEGVRGNREVPPATEEAAESGNAEPDVAALQAERDELFDRLQRLAAEFDNYRKRSARDAASLTLRANERLVKELLPILDDLGRALEAAEEHEGAAERPVRERGPGEGARGNREVPSTNSATLEGIRLVHRALAELLAKEGLAEIETDGQFDPHVHEALLSQPSDADEGSVIEVVQKGYKLGDRVLRPARVVVAAKSAAEPPVRGSGPGEGAPGEPGGPPAPREE
jgi:molecular chaperone GrpE